MNGISVAELRQVLEADRAVSDLGTYFGTARYSDPLEFTGSRFELLGGGGDRDEVKNTVTATDIVAVQLLSVRIPPRVCLDLLEGPLGAEVNDQLSFLPTDVCLGEEGSSSWLVRDSHADRAWQYLKSEGGIGFVTAGKILARKRPHLVPVYDTVVRCAIRRPSGGWVWTWFADMCGDAGVHQQLLQLHHEAKLPIEVGLLRVLDVVLWMRHRREHRRQGCPGLTL